MKSYNGLVFFEGSIDGQNENLIVSDGTLNGTRVLKSNLDFESLDMFPYKNFLYFRGNDGDNVELWKTDGTETGTTKVIDLDDDSALEGSFPRIFTIYKDELIFEATQFGITGAELWKTDGTESGTQIIQDLTPGTGSTSFYEFYATDNELLINLEENSAIGRELYKYVGSSTASVDDFYALEKSKIYYSDKNIYFKDLDKTAKLRLYNIQGKEVIKDTQLSPEKNWVNVNLSSGFYIVKIHMERGKILSKKIVID